MSSPRRPAIAGRRSKAKTTRSPSPRHNAEVVVFLGNTICVADDDGGMHRHRPQTNLQRGTSGQPQLIATEATGAQFASVAVTVCKRRAKLNTSFEIREFRGKFAVRTRGDG